MRTWKKIWVYGLSLALVVSSWSVEVVAAQPCCRAPSQGQTCCRPARPGLLARWRHRRRARATSVAQVACKPACPTSAENNIEIVYKDGKRFQIVRSPRGCTIHIPLPPGHPGIPYDRLPDGRIVPRSPFSLSGTSGQQGASNPTPCAWQFLACCQVETNDYCMEQYLICIQALQEEQLHTECPVSVVEPDDPPYTTPEEENSVDAEPSPSDTLDRQ